MQARQGAAIRNMITLLTIFHVIVCIFLVLVVLLQQGKGADWAGAFGGGGTQTAFGARGAGTLLSKATTTGAAIFMITSLALAILIPQPGGSSVVREGARQQNAPAQQPAGQPAAQPPAAPQQGTRTPATPATPAAPATPEKK